MDNPLTQLHCLIVERLNLNELRTLCLDLRINYDDIPGEALSGKARELILIFARQRRLDQLLTSLARTRRDLSDEPILSIDPVNFYDELSHWSMQPAPIQPSTTDVQEHKRDGGWIIRLKARWQRQSETVKAAYIGLVGTLIVALCGLCALFSEIPGKAWDELFGDQGTKVAKVTLTPTETPLPPTLTSTPTETPTTPTSTPTVPPPSPTDIPTPTETPTPTITPAPSNTPTTTPSPTPTPFIDLIGWEKYKDELGSSIDVSTTDNTIAISYALAEEGHVGIAKVIGPGEMLSGTDGLRFSYSSSGASNTIELKLLYRVGTGGIGGVSPTFSISRTQIIGTGKWAQAMYSDFKCWKETHQDWSVQDRCPSEVDLGSIWKIEITISNKPGDERGHGEMIIHNGLQCIY